VPSVESSAKRNLWRLVERQAIVSRHRANTLHRANWKQNAAKNAQNVQAVNANPVTPQKHTAFIYFLSGKRLNFVKTVERENYQP
jgi:hypothetical protein